MQSRPHPRRVGACRDGGSVEGPAGGGGQGVRREARVVAVERQQEAGQGGSVGVGVRHVPARANDARYALNQPGRSHPLSPKDGVRVAGSRRPRWWGGTTSPGGSLSTPATPAGPARVRHTPLSHLALHSGSARMVPMCRTTVPARSARASPRTRSKKASTSAMASCAAAQKDAARSPVSTLRTRTGFSLKETRGATGCATGCAWPVGLAEPVLSATCSSRAARYHGHNYLRVSSPEGHHEGLEEELEGHGGGGDVREGTQVFGGEAVERSQEVLHQVHRVVGPGIEPRGRRGGRGDPH